MGLFADTLAKFRKTLTYMLLVSSAVGYCHCSFGDNSDEAYQTVQLLIDGRHEDAYLRAMPVAKKGNPLAQFIVGYSIKLSNYSLGSVTDALQWLRLSASQNSVEGQFGVADLLHNNPDLQSSKYEAHAAALKAAEAEHGLAANLAGAMHHNNNLVPDPHRVFYHKKRAVFWFRKAANAGIALGQFNLAEAYRVGNGVNKNEVMAMSLYLEAAEQDMPEAQFMVAAGYGDGRGLKKDRNASTFWLCKSARQGYSLALAYMDNDLSTCVGSLAPQFNQNVAHEKNAGRNSPGTNSQVKNKFWDYLLTGVVLWGAYELIDELSDDSSPSYDLSKTKNMSSSQLGAELLKQKREKGISGRGVVVPYDQPSIGYDPNVPSTSSIRRLPANNLSSSGIDSNSASEKNSVPTAYVISSSNSSLCNYFSGGKTISISKRNSWAVCPSNVNLPASSGVNFEIDQMGQSTGNSRILIHGKSATSADYCYYSNNVQIPKSSYGSCPQMIEY